MAGSIKAVIATQFDATGLNKATKEFGKLGSSMKGLLATAGLAVGIGAVVSGLKDAAKAATDDVKSQALLANQMKNTVGATKEQTAAVEASIQKMQMLAGVADDEIRPAFATLLRSTKDIGQATGLTALALDIAAGTGKDLGSVSLALGKAVNGSNTALLKLIPSIKGAKDPMAELQKQFGGMAEAAANNDPFQRMSIIFQDIQEQVGMALLPALQELATWLASPVGQVEIAKMVDLFKGFALAVGNVIIWLKDNYKWILAVAGLGAVIMGLSAAWEAVTGAVKLMTAAQLLLNLAMDANPIGLIILAVAGLATAWTLAANAATGYASASADATDTGGSGGTSTPLNADGSRMTLGQYNKTHKIKPKATPVDPQVQSLKDLQKQIDAMNNAGKIGNKTVDKAAAARAAAAKKAAEAQAKIVQAAQDANDKAKKAFEDLKASVDDFNKSFGKTADAFKAVFRFSAPLGEFEQQAVDAFDSMRQAAQDAFDQGLIPASALASLKAYADQEQTLLQGIAKQRDQLARKISIAQAVTNSVMGSLDINSMLESETKQVTRSVTSMVNGIALTTTQTFDEVVTSGLADSFKKLVDKTKTFAANLIKLKALGLNGNLFKQIVDAGATTGGATAEAIIAGGADAVKELNGLFKDLTDAGSTIAETATPVMYSLGEDMTNSFIDGLRSQDQVLISQASAMAALFTSSFQTQLSSAMAPTINASANLAGMGMDNTDFIRGYGRVTGYGTTPTGGAITNNITVNAGVVANKQELPSIIVDALNTAAKQGLSTRIINAI